MLNCMNTTHHRHFEHYVSESKYMYLQDCRKEKNNDAVITIVHKITVFFKCSSYFDVISIICISDRIQLTTTISTIYS